MDNIIDLSKFDDIFTCDVIESDLKFSWGISKHNLNNSWELFKFNHSQKLIPVQTNEGIIYVSPTFIFNLKKYGSYLKAPQVNMLDNNNNKATINYGSDAPKYEICPAIPIEYKIDDIIRFLLIVSSYTKSSCHASRPSYSESQTIILCYMLDYYTLTDIRDDLLNQLHNAINFIFHYMQSSPLHWYNSLWTTGGFMHNINVIFQYVKLLYDIQYITPEIKKDLYPIFIKCIEYFPLMLYEFSNELNVNNILKFFTNDNENEPIITEICSYFKDKNKEKLEEIQNEKSYWNCVDTVKNIYPNGLRPNVEYIINVVDLTELLGYEIDSMDTWVELQEYLLDNIGLTHGNFTGVFLPHTNSNEEALLRIYTPKEYETVKSNIIDFFKNK